MIKIKANPILPLILFGGISVAIAYIGIISEDLIALIIGAVGFIYTVTIFTFFNYMKVEEDILIVYDRKLVGKKVKISEIKKIALDQGYRSLVPIVKIETNGDLVKVNIMAYSHGSLKVFFSELQKHNSSIEYNQDMFS